MLNINNPESKLILNAAVYIDAIKSLCTKFIVEDFEDRKATFLEMKLQCVELNKFSKVNFVRNPERISKLIDRIIYEIEKLEGVNILTQPGNCKVCNNKLNTFDTLLKEKQHRYKTICEKCPNEIIYLLCDLESLTGVWLI